MKGDEVVEALKERPTRACSPLLGTGTSISMTFPLEMLKREIPWASISTWLRNESDLSMYAR
jgi:hypothetical protein